MAQPNSTAFEAWLHFMSKWEGGYVNHPSDPGGHTNRGVTLATWNSKADEFGLVKGLEALKAMSDTDFRIFAWQYWIDAGADRITNTGIAAALADFAYNAGPVQAVRSLQIALLSIPNGHSAIVADGIIGPRTLAAVNAANSEQIFRLYLDARVAFYKALNTQAVSKTGKPSPFLAGWLNRTSALRSEFVTFAV